MVDSSSILMKIYHNKKEIEALSFPFFFENLPLSSQQLQRVYTILNNYKTKLSEYKVDSFIALSLIADRHFIDLINVNTDLNFQPLLTASFKSFEYSIALLDTSLADKNNLLVNVHNDSIWFALYQQRAITLCDKAELSSLNNLNISDVDNIIVLAEQFNKFVPFDKYLYCFSKSEVEQTEDEILLKLSASFPQAEIYCQRYDICDVLKDYNKDITDFSLPCAQRIATKFYINQPHCAVVSEYCSLLCKTFKLSKRDKKLLSLAAILHETGKYISINHYKSCSKEIIKHSILFGLTEREHTLLSLILLGADAFSDNSSLSQKDRVSVDKLAVIFMVADALDYSHLQKITSIKINIKDNKLNIKLDTLEDFQAEKEQLLLCQHYFLKVFGMDITIKYHNTEYGR